MQGRDDLDFYIKSSFKDIPIDKDYNERLLNRVESIERTSSSKIPALCMIFSGILLIFLNFTSLYEKIFSVQSLFIFRMNILIQNLSKLMGV